MKIIKNENIDYKKHLLQLSNNDKAILTHYIHNIDGEDVASFYRTKALRILDILSKEIHITPKKTTRELLSTLKDIPFPTLQNNNFSFIDLFAGIGGFRIAMQNLGGKCIYSSEWNKDAQITYNENFGEIPFGDITQAEVKENIPQDFDILCAGFPCQAFSVAGLRKGFSDTRGTLFFDIEEIVTKHRPKVVFLENVKNLVSHDKGKTFKIITEILEKKLGYKIYYQVLNTMTHANIPQNRERIFIIAFDPKRVPNHINFKFPESIPLNRTIHDLLETKKPDEKYYYQKDHMYYPELEKTMLSTNTIYQWRRVYVRENKNNVCPTLTANMGAGGHNVPLIKDKYGIRKLTPKECFAFQGYPMDKFKMPAIADSKLYMQAGNSVTTTLVERISNEIIRVL